MTFDPMKAWRDLRLKSFFRIDGEVFQKNSYTTAISVDNPMMGERVIGPMEAKAIQPYVPPPGKAPIQAPRNPEDFGTKLVEHEASPDPNFGATKVSVTPVDTHIEQGIQPSKPQPQPQPEPEPEPKPEPKPAKTTKRQRKAKQKSVETPKEN